jgi:hypothetical protein
MGVYVGGRFNYFLGKTEETPPSKVTVGMMWFGVEGGYELKFDQIFVRPYVGLGLARAHAEVCIQSMCGDGTSESKFSVVPGVAAGYSFGPAFVYVDPHYYVVFADSVGDASALGIGGGVGMAF